MNEIDKLIAKWRLANRYCWQAHDKLVAQGVSGMDVLNHPDWKRLEKKAQDILLEIRAAEKEQL